MKSFLDREDLLRNPIDETRRDDLERLEKATTDPVLKSALTELLWQVDAHRQQICELASALDVSSSEALAYADNRGWGYRTRAQDVARAVRSGRGRALQSLARALRSGHARNHQR